MSSGFNAEYRTEYSANTLNLNQAANTVLATFFFPRKARVRRYGVISEAAAGLLAPGALNLATSAAGGASFTEVSSSILTHGARARGIGVTKTLGSRLELEAGSLLQVRVDVDAGGASTGRVWIEVEDEPFSGTAIPSTWVASS
ncbi:MAG: hypothetical protein ACWGPN_11550 [Gammaproteobacteria bacterium]